MHHKLFPVSVATFETCETPSSKWTGRRRGWKAKFGNEPCRTKRVLPPLFLGKRFDLGLCDVTLGQRLDRERENPPRGIFDIYSVVLFAPANVSQGMVHTPFVERKKEKRKISKLELSGLNEASLTVYDYERPWSQNTSCFCDRAHQSGEIL